MTNHSAHLRSVPKPLGPAARLAAFLSLSLSLTIAPTAQAQTLTLFEDVETAATTPNAPQRLVETARGAPQFTLIGTSQLGDRHRARLRTADGESISVELGARGSAPIPGYPGYRIDEAGHRHVMVQHPASAPCFEFSAQGVSCADDHVSHLQLMTAQAVQPEAPVEDERRSRRGRGPQADAEGQEPGLTRQETRRAAPPDNPFAAALRAARERGDAPPASAPRAVQRAGGERFQPRRIDPSQVPEGARLVRTPFGDRIVID